MSSFGEQQRPRCFPLTLVIDCCKPESVPKFLTNLSLSDLYNLPGESVAMNAEILSAMRAGNQEFLVKMRSYETPMACLKNDKGDSILHLAAAVGHLKLVESIIFECPSLLLEPNWKDQIPLHVAARAGHLDVVKTFIASITYISANILSERERGRFNLYVLKDMDGDTPLHAALKGRYLKTALCLVNANPLGSFLANNDEISPLFIAVEAGGLPLVKVMLKGLGNNVQGQISNLASKLEGRKSLVHAALKAKNTDILEIILNEEPSLVDERDEEGRTCLSIGASEGFCKGVCKLLNRSRSSIFECNVDGSFPIHVAVEKGHVDVVKDIIKHCPDSIELLNKQGQNILHIAAKSGKAGSSLLKYIKRLDRKMNHLIEDQDVDGNTPLHLATINWRPRIVRDLIRFPSDATRIMKIQNKDGLRALDIAELNLQFNYILRERLTLMILICTYKPSGYEKISISGMTLRSRSEPHDAKKYKDRVNTLLVVAALVATVTFAACLSIPGGFNSSGMANLANTLNMNANFIVFVVFDMVAIQSSLVAIIALIWAQMGDPELIHKAFQWALPSLALALTCMSFAFLYGVIATTSQSLLLSIVFSIFYLPSSYTLFELLSPYVGFRLLFPYIGVRLSEWQVDNQIRVLLRFVNEDDAEICHTSCFAQTSV